MPQEASSAIMAVPFAGPFRSQEKFVPLLAPLCLSSLLFASVAFASPVHLETEHRTQPLDIDVAIPRFAWQSDASTPDWMQQAYQIQVSTDEQALRSGKAEV